MPYKSLSTQNFSKKSHILKFEDRHFVAKCVNCGKITNYAISQLTAYQNRGKFCSRECMFAFQKSNSELHPLHKKEGYVDNSGYITKTLSTPNGAKRIREHRLVMETHLGRKLLSTEVVHHINGDKKDNRIENLVICTKSEHHKQHGDLSIFHKVTKEQRILFGKKTKEKWITESKWSRLHENCSVCGTVTIPHQAKGLCRKCYISKWKLDLEQLCK